MASERFIEYLQTGDLEGLGSVPKSDLHNHAPNGGSVEYLKQFADIDVGVRPAVFASITEMENWAHEKIKRFCTSEMRYEAAFAQAAADGVSVLALSFFRDAMERFGTCGQFVRVFREIKNKHIPDTLFLPELSYYGSSDADKIDYEYSLMDEILSYNYFTSVDLCCDGLAQPAPDYKSFKKIFAKAKAAGLKLKAHVGEYGTADDVKRAVEELELDEVHHGITAASSPQIMKWLARHKIRLNVCPTSNVMLGRVSGYKAHPIRVLFDYGVPVTINTDDMLIFNQSVSQEYMNLYSCGLMTAVELDEIRRLGLSERI